MKYIVFLLIVVTVFSCKRNKKEVTGKIVEVKSAKKEMPQNVYVHKSDSIFTLLKRGELEPEEIIQTKTTTVYNGKSFNEFLNPVNVNDIIIIGRTTREELLEKLGSPDSITKEPNFVGDDGGFEERFWYKNSNFRTFDGKVQTVDLADPDFVVNKSIKVGMSEQMIKKLFPVSFNSGRNAEKFWRYKGKGYDMEYSVLSGDDILSIVTKDGRIIRILFIYSV